MSVEIEFARMADALPEPARTIALAKVSPRLRLDLGIHVSAQRLRELGFGLPLNHRPIEARRTPEATA